MTNKIRSRAYFKIKRSINSCKNILELDTALTMIAAHPSIEETNALHQIYNQKIEVLQSRNAGTKALQGLNAGAEAGDELTHPCASTFEDEIETEIHKKTCGTK